jgi:hypothetical protein
MSSAGGRSAQIDKVSGKLATNCTPELAKESVYSSAILPEITKTENPSQYQNWLTALQKAGYSTSGGDLPTDSDDVHSCDDEKPKVNLVGLNGGGPYNFSVEVTSGHFAANKLHVYFDDQIISTQVINGTGSYDISYAPTVTGSHTFKAVVTDAGLYQATDDQAVTVTNTGGSSFQGKSPADGASVSIGSVNFKWTADDGASSYDLYVDGTKRATSTGTSKSYTIVSPGSHTWYVRSDLGNATDPMSFTAHL